MKKIITLLLFIVSCQRPIEAELAQVEEDSLSDWQVLEMAIMMTESRFNPDAIGATSDWGVMQITPVYVAEANRFGGEFTHEDAFSIEKSLEMFSIVQGNHNPDGDIERAIRLHNKAPWYAKRVKENIALIRRMEEARKVIIGKED